VDTPRNNTPSVAEVAALTARLRALTAAGRDADPAERAAFLADKDALLARIAEPAVAADVEYDADRAFDDLTERRPLSGEGPESWVRDGRGGYSWVGEDEMEAAAEPSTDGDLDSPVPYQLTDLPDPAPERATEVVGLECPECGEDAVEQAPAALVPYDAHDRAIPRYAHPDGEPLCPVMGARGYEPAQPREVLHEHTIPASRVATDPMADESTRREQLARWHTDDQAAEQGTDDGMLR
jgi:hypothetical protein